MARPIFDNLSLSPSPDCTLVLPDAGDKSNTGIVFWGISEGSRVLFIREMTTEVRIDGVKYLAMPSLAVVGF